MRKYEYKAKDKGTGKIVTGTVQAENENSAGKVLVDQGYVPSMIEIKEGGGFLCRLTNLVSG